MILNLKVRKQTRSEANKNKVITKKVSNISLNWVNLLNQISFWILQKSKLQKITNSKLKEKYSVNGKTNLATEKNFVPQHSLKINGGWGAWGVRKKIEKQGTPIYKAPFRSLCWYSKIFHSLGTFPLLWCVHSTTNLSYFNQWMTCLLYLRNGLLWVMMQQSCNNALPIIGEELAHMKCNLHKISQMSLPQWNYHFVECRVFFL